MPARTPSICRERLFSLFRDMVDLYSPSGKEEELTDYLDDYLQSHGLVVERQPVDETRCNLLVKGGNPAPGILYLGHIDTVPAFDFEQYGFEQREGLCCGLGTADMKSGCAAMIEAFVAASQAECLPADVLLALVVGEEESGDGTQALLESYRFDHALVGEPTDLSPCLEHYGYVELIVRAFGSRRHAAMSGRETNAVRAMLRLLLNFEERVEQNEPETVLNIRNLHSSDSGFAVPDRCSASIDFHIPPGVRAGDFGEAIEDFVRQSSLADAGLGRFELDFPTKADGFRLQADEVLPRKLRRVFDAVGLSWRPTSFRSHSDANLLRDAGCSPLMLGPGMLGKAHTREESVLAEQVVAAAELYALLLAEL